MDILEEISGISSDKFTLFNIELPTNSYMIACTNFQIFEEGENCASTISVEHTIGCDMNLCVSDLFVSDMILFGSSFKFQYIWVMLVAVLINFGVKNQVPQVSFKIVLGIWCKFSLMTLLILYFMDH